MQGVARDGRSRAAVHVVRGPRAPRLLAAWRHSADAPGAEAQSPVGRRRPLQPRPRYERQGVLVEEAAIKQAEAECLADEDARARRREREAERRRAGEDEFQRALAREITRPFGLSARARAETIARHTGERGSGRVGRAAGTRALDPGRRSLAVVASVRHRDTDYDDLLMAGVERSDARVRVRAGVERTLERWREPELSAAHDARRLLGEWSACGRRGRVVLDRLGADEDRRSGLARGSSRPRAGARSAAPAA